MIYHYFSIKHAISWDWFPNSRPTCLGINIGREEHPVCELRLSERTIRQCPSDLPDLPTVREVILFRGRSVKSTVHGCWPVRSWDGYPSIQSSRRQLRIRFVFGRGWPRHILRDRRGTWRYLHLRFTLKSGTWKYLPSFRVVVGVALGDIYFRFAWQAWYFWHSAASGGALGRG